MNYKHFTFSPRLKQMIERINPMWPLKILLSHPDKYGYGICLPEGDQVIHVWFEMAAYYEQFSLSEQYWIHCFGFDNGFYYLLFISSLLRAMNPTAKLPDVIITNDFLELSGQKFSTSREHAIWSHEFSKNVDHLRLYLSLNRPVTRAENFAMDHFEHFSVNMENQLMKLNQRAELIAQQEISSIQPQKLIACNRAMRNMECYLSPTHLDLRRAARELVIFIDFALQATEMGGSEKLILHTLAILMSPFMPNESKRLLLILNVTTPAWIKDWSNIYSLTLL